MQFKMSSATCFNLDQSKILSSGTGLIIKFNPPPHTHTHTKEQPEIMSNEHSKLVNKTIPFMCQGKQPVSVLVNFTQEQPKFTLENVCLFI